MWKKIIDSRDPPTDCDPLDGSPIRPVPPSLLSRQGLNPLGGVGIQNGTPLYGETLHPIWSTVLLSDSSHSITKRIIANTAIRRKSTGGVSALLEVAKSSGEAIATTMREMTSVTKETESNKLEVQLRLFFGANSVPTRAWHARIWTKSTCGRQRLPCDSKTRRNSESSRKYF